MHFEYLCPEYRFDFHKYDSIHSPTISDLASIQIGNIGTISYVKFVMNK